MRYGDLIAILSGLLAVGMGMIAYHFSQDNCLAIGVAMVSLVVSVAVVAVLMKRGWI